MKYFVMLALILFAVGLSAQFADQWVFNSSIGTYTEITGGTIMGTAVEGSVGAASLDDVLYELPTGTIPWQFWFDGEHYSGLTVSSNAQVIIGGSTYLGHTPLSSSVVASGCIALLARDLQGLVTAGSLGEMRYQVVGTAPNREFVVQWKNFKKYGTANNNESYNFQLRLQEGTHRIRINYGLMTVNATNGNPQVGLRGSSNANYMGRTTTTDWMQSTAATINTATMTLTTTVAPALGLQYDFTLAAPPNPPNPAIAITPLDAAQNVAIQTSLVWESGGGETIGYRISFGTDNPPTNIENNTDLGNVLLYQPAQVLTYDTEYFWKITPYNEVGETQNVVVWSFRTKTDPTIFQLPYSQNFSSPILPADWAVYMQGSATISVLGGFVTMSISELPGLVCLTAPPLDNSISLQNLRLRFASQDAGAIKVGMMSDPMAIDSFELLEIVTKPSGTAWLEYVVNLGTYTGTSRYIAFLVDAIGQQKIDNVFIETKPLNDLAIGSLGGNYNPRVGITELYTVQIRNLGSNSQTNYQVKLLNGTVELVSVAGIPLAASQSTLIRIPWTPVNAINHSLKAVLTLSQDEIVANNSSAVMTVTVSNDPNYSFVLGTGTLFANYPIDTTFRASKYQTIYQTQSFGTPMNISGISFYTFFSEAAAQIPIKLWVANTTQSDLSQGFIPIQELTLVYDGLMNFAQGSNLAYFPFTQPFAYNGGNIAVMALRGYTETTYSAQNRFASFSAGYAQSRLMTSSLDDILPSSQGGIIVDKAPKIAFHGSVSSIGHLRGVLLDFNNHPIPDVTIHLSGRPDVVTNQFGAYEFMYYPAGTYTLSCNVLGYNDYSQQISLPTGQVIVHNILPVPYFSIGSVAGYVRTTQGVPIAGAMLISEDFYTHSDSAGNYVLNLPIGTHNITITANEYHPQSINNVIVTENNTTTLNITLIHESDNEDPLAQIPITTISGNFPNPFNPSTTIKYSLAKTAHATIEIFNIKGQVVKTLVDGERSAGNHEARWNGLDDNGRKVSSGIYLIRLKHDGKTASRKMMLMK